MATSFPRGSNLELKHEDKKSSKRSLNEDAIFGNKRAKRIEIVDNKKKSKKSAAQATPVVPSLQAIGLGMTQSVASNKKIKIEPMSIDKFTSGSLVLGYVLAITESKVIVSLPGGFTGAVAYQEISDVVYRQVLDNANNKSKNDLPDINTLVKPLQQVRCYVIQQTEKPNSKKKNIVLSMRGSLVNKGLALKHFSVGFAVAGCVASKEDRGYIIASGISGVNCFLPEKSWPSDREPLVIGQPVECVTTALNEGSRTATVKANHRAVYEAITRSSLLSFNSLIPGMLFNVVIDKLAENGLTVSFLSIFHGVIDTSSLNRPYKGSEWQSKYTVGDVLQARIVYVDHATKSIRLSLRPHILEMRVPANLPALGDVLHNLTVATVFKKQGILLLNNDCEDEEEEQKEEKNDDEKDDNDDNNNNDDENKNEDNKKSHSKKENASKRKEQREKDEAIQGVFIHKSSLTEDNLNLDEDEQATPESEAIDIDRINKVFKVGNNIAAVRVIGYNLVEGWILASNFTEVIEGNIVHASNVTPGQQLSVEIVAIKDFGLILKIANSKITAVCPTFHTGDVVSDTKLKKKFKIGQKLSMRVWEVEGNSIIMTNKKTMVELKEKDVIESYDKANIGTVVTGVISSVNREGLTVRFFNKVRGLVPMIVLTKQGILDPVDSYRSGQIIRTVVINKGISHFKDKKAKTSSSSVQSNKPHGNLLLYLALDLNVDPKATVKLCEGVQYGNNSNNNGDSNTYKSITENNLNGNNDNNSDQRLRSESVDSTKNDIIMDRAVEFVSGSIYKVDDNKEYAMVRLDDGRSAKIHKHHFGDFSSSSEVLFAESYKVGSRIEHALVLSSYKGTLNVTLKPLLVKAATNSNDDNNKKSSTAATSEKLGSAYDEITVPNRVSDLTPGQVVAGYVSKVETFGVLVRFRGSLSALAPRPNIADKFIATPIGLYHVGDSVRCVIQRVDMTKERAVVTFKPSMVTPSNGNISYLNAYLHEHFLAESMTLKKSQKIVPAWKNYPLSTVVKATISSIEEYGVVLLGDDQTTIMLARNVSEEKQKELSVGKSVKARILDIDLENSVLDVSLDSSLIKGIGSDGSSTKEKDGKKKRESKAPSDLKLDSNHTATILLVKDKYLVVSISKHIGYVMIADYHSPHPDTTEYEVGKTIQIRVHQVNTKYNINDTATVTVENNTQEYPHDGLYIFTLATNTDTRAQAAKVQKEAEESDKQLHQRLSGVWDETVPVPVMRQKFVESLRVGALFKWIVTTITPLEVTLQPEHHEKLGLNIKATLHITGAINQFQSYDDLSTQLSVKDIKKEINSAHPFFGLTIGTTIWCYIQQVRRQPEKETKNNNSNSKKSKKETKQQAEDREDAKLLRDEFIIYVLQSHKLANIDSHGHKHTPFRSMIQAYGKDEIRSPSVKVVAITKIDATGVTVAFSPYVNSHLNFLDVSSDEDIVSKIKKHAFVGMRLLVAVTQVIKENDKLKGIKISRVAIEKLADDSNNKYELSKAKEINPFIESIKIEEGSIVDAIINLQPSRTIKSPAIMLLLPGGNIGRVCVTEYNNREQWQDFEKFFNNNNSDNSRKLPDGRKHGDIVKCRVLSIDEQHVEVSLRSWRINNSKLTQALKEDLLPVEGEIIKGYVVNASTKGVFVRISKANTAQVLMKDLSDTYIEKPELSYPTGKLVEARVLAVNQIESHVRLTLKESKIHGDSKAKEEIAHLKVGQTVTGIVERVTDAGVFVKIKGTSLVGLSRRAAALNHANKNLKDEYEVDSVVRAKILTIGKTTMKIGLGLKDFYFKGDTEGDQEEEDNEMDVDGENDDDNNDDNDDEEEEDNSDDSEVESMIKAAALHSDSDEDDNNDEEDEDENASDDEEEEQPVVNNARKRKASEDSTERKPSKIQANKSNKKRQDSDDDSEDEENEDSNQNIFSSSGKTKVNASLQWDDFAPATKNNDEDDNSDDEDEDEENGGKTSRIRKKQKEASKRRAEETTRAREAALAKGTLIPESKDDFERLLIAQPNSSFLWVQYMAFHLQSADIETARNIAARALRTIGFREEDEKYNVWIALLNMEHKYGSMESLEKAFTKAVAESKGKLIYLSMAETYEKAGDNAGAEAIFNKALKKPQYKKSKKVWIAYLTFKLRIGDIKGAKEQLARGMQSLSKHKHIEVISKYALAEFDIGSADRGRVLFEELMSNYPKRTDLWHLYVDKEVKLGNIDQSRQLFERMIASKTNAKNIRAIFKKYLAFEEKYGDEETQEGVKQKARDYVNSLA